MMRITLLLLFFSTIALAQKAEIKEKLDVLQEAMLKPNAELLASLVDDGLVYVHSSGTVRNKEGFVREFMEGQTKIFTSEFIDQKVTFPNKSLAIVRHNWQADTNYDNKPGKIDILVMMVWKKSKGEWKLIARQAASIVR
jgi:hypothetical protein